MVAADVGGCQVGVVAKTSNIPMLKPWRFVSNNSDLVRELGKLRCAKVHEHAPCSGGDTTRTGFYSKMLADIMDDNMFIESCSASVVYHQPPSGSLGFNSRKSNPAAKAIDIQPVVLSSKTFVSDLSHIAVNAAHISDTWTSELHDEFYDYLVEFRNLAPNCPKDQFCALFNEGIRIGK